MIQVTEDVLRAALLTACNYYASPAFRDILTNNVVPKLQQKIKLKTVDSVIGDIFANVYTNVLKLPPQQYQKWVSLFFEITTIT